MNISIFGLGYVGCVGMGCLAESGNNVIGVDVVDTKVNLINSGKPTIIEKDINRLIAENHKRGLIKATKDFEMAVKETDISIICVGTPSSPEGHLNLNYLYRTAENIANGLLKKETFHIIVIRSTVMPGTNEKVGEIIEKVSGRTKNKDFSIVSNPEFLREGSAVIDYYNPAVTVLGCDHQKTLEIMRTLYKDINAPIEIVDVRVAEIIKYVNNSFHALKIVFANEVGSICKKMGIDSHEVMELFCKDDQLNISTRYFKPGYAYGGSCLPKDLKGLKTLAHDYYLDVPVINSIELSNSKHKELVYGMIADKGYRKIGILGLSFKAGTDDLRYSPSVELAEKLLGKGFSLSIFDENVNLSNISGTNESYIKKHIPHISSIITDDLEQVINVSEVLVITQMNKKFEKIQEMFPTKHIIDLVRFSKELDPTNYEGICW